MVLLSVFDSVDDTVLVKKTIITVLAENFSDLVASPQGRKVLLYLLARRNTKHFGPQVLERLREGDDNPHSKKEAEVGAGVGRGGHDCYNLPHYSRSRVLISVCGDVNLRSAALPTSPFPYSPTNKQQQQQHTTPPLHWCCRCVPQS